jgi:hypothetical protein
LRKCCAKKPNASTSTKNTPPATSSPSSNKNPKNGGSVPSPPATPRIYWEKLLVNYGDDHLAMRDDQYIQWRDGRTYTADGHELMYLHFHRLKATIKTCNFTYGDRPRRIRLSRHEIHGD